MYIPFDELLEEAKSMLKYRLPKGFVWTVSGLKDNFEVSLSEEFKKTFPRYTELISLADVKEFSLHDQVYRFYQWIDKNGEPIVWLSDLGTQDLENVKVLSKEKPVLRDELIAEHRLLLDNVGGITETWDEIEDEAVLTWAKDFVFSHSGCYKLLDQKVIYGEDGWVFEEVDELKQLPIADLICFSLEANGNSTYYNKCTQEVFLLLHDHCFDYVEVLAGHPEYSFYTINNIKTFVEYAELLAQQILDNIKN